MRFCERHWTALREAIDDRGLGHLVANSGSAVASMMGNQGESLTLANFEPLMGAHNAILQHALDSGGPGVLMQDGCPIEWLQTEHARICTKPDCQDRDGAGFEEWIDKAADEAKLTYDALTAAPSSEKAAP